MLPDAEDGPALGAQCAVDAAVPGLVAGDLGQPEGGVGLGPGGVFGAAVPETTVHEHGDAEPGEDEVGADSAGELWTSNAQL